jgi:hypothetical protein
MKKMLRYERIARTAAMLGPIQKKENAANAIITMKKTDRPINFRLNRMIRYALERTTAKKRKISLDNLNQNGVFTNVLSPIVPLKKATVS